MSLDGSSLIRGCTELALTTHTSPRPSWSTTHASVSWVMISPTYAGRKDATISPPPRQPAPFQYQSKFGPFVRLPPIVKRNLAASRNNHRSRCATKWVAVDHQNVFAALEARCRVCCVRHCLTSREPVLLMFSLHKDTYPVCLPTGCDQKQGSSLRAPRGPSRIISLTAAL